MYKNAMLLEKLDDFSIPEPNSGCWVWLGSVHSDKSPYGRLWWGGTCRSAHRASYECHVGKIPDGMVVMHKCDNPSCINPSHLTLGTLAENNADMTRKGRRAMGEAITRARVTEAQAREIIASNLPTAELAERYGMSKRGIRGIRQGMNWKHLHTTGRPI